MSVFVHWRQISLESDAAGMLSDLYWEVLVWLEWENVLKNENKYTRPPQPFDEHFENSATQSQNDLSVK